MSDFLEQIKSLIAEREDAEKARDASQARVDEITAELATVAEFVASYTRPKFEPALEPAPRKHRKTRSDAGVPRKVVDKEAVTPLDPLDQMIRDAAAFNRPEHRATTEAGDAV